MSDIDPFAAELPRDGYGRPQIIPVKKKRGGVVEPDLTARLVPYTRASTFAKALSDGGGLTDWKVGHAVLGTAVSPDLAAMAAALGRNYNDFTRDQKAALREIAERAHDRSGGNDKANYGTAVHSLTEPDPFGVAIDPRMAADVAAYELALSEAGIEVVDAEQFVVNDELRAAGTYDHRYRLTRDLAFSVGNDGDGMYEVLPSDTLLLGDKKTGTLHFDEHAIQLAIYARGKGYDHTTGERTSLDVSPQWGLLAHIPRGEAKCTLYLVDLHAGCAGAKLAGQVREYRAKPGRLSTVIGEASATLVPAELVDEIATSGSVTELQNEVDLGVAQLSGVAQQVADAAAFADEVADAKKRANDALIAAREINDAEELRAEIAVKLAEATPTVEQAVETLTETLGATDLILDEIAKANTETQLTALWHKHKVAWGDEHTAATKARIAKLNEW